MQVMALYVAVVLIWGTTWIAITFQLGLVAEEVSVAYRFFLGSISLFVYALVSRRQISIPRHQYGNVVITGMLMFSANYLFTYYAINYISSGLVAVAFSLMVVGNATMERLFFKSRLENRILIASGLGILGVSCIFWPEISALSWTDRAVSGIVLSLIAVGFASLGNMGAIRNYKRELPLVAVNAHGMAWGAAASATIAVLRGHEFTFSWETGYIASLLYLAIFGSAVAFGCYLALLRLIGSARAAYTTVLFPIVALLISTFFEDFRWSVLAIVGVLFIIAGNWLALTKVERT